MGGDDKPPKSEKKHKRSREEESPAEAVAASAKKARAEPADDSDAEGGASSGPAYVAPIANPLAGKKLHKKVMKVVKKAAGAKILRRGVKEVVKALRKGEKGLTVLAADISPIDVLSHIPILCEDVGVPYLFVSGKAELGAAAGTKRPTSVVLVTTKTAKGDKPAFDAADKLAEVMEEAKALAPKA